MKLLSLISGGKDGIYSIIAAQRQGHEVVMLGHMKPNGQDDVHELDSFMYQTVGHNIVPAIAECLDLPLIERAITGAPVSTDALEYAPKEGDEVEDLFHLVQEALTHRNDIEGILTGAIASQYQLQRVLNVATRLGLKTVEPLWGREQTGLLQEMIENKMDAIIIKTCSMGLKEEHLGRSITDLYPEFIKIRDKHGFNMCGEGGEFESLVLDCPVYKKKLVITEHKHIHHSKDPFAPTILYVPVKWEIHSKATWETTHVLSTGNATIMVTFSPLSGHMGDTGGLGGEFAAEKLISLLNPKTATKYTSITSYDDLAKGHHDITPQRTELDHNTPFVAVDIPSKPGIGKSWRIILYQIYIDV